MQEKRNVGRKNEVVDGKRLGNMGVREIKREAENCRCCVIVSQGRAAAHEPTTASLQIIPGALSTKQLTAGCASSFRPGVGSGFALAH